MEDNYDLNTQEGIANAVAWQTNMVNILVDGAKWVVPRSNTIYGIHKTNKTAVIITGGEEAIDRIFELMGWKVLDQRMQGKVK